MRNSSVISALLLVYRGETLEFKAVSDHINRIAAATEPATAPEAAYRVRIARALFLIVEARP